MYYLIREGETIDSDALILHKNISVLTERKIDVE